MNGEMENLAKREFVNEFGNRIRITIEGPTSTSENILTPMEAEQLRAALCDAAAATSEIAGAINPTRRTDMAFIRWLKWWFLETRRCSHERDGGRLIDMGRSKAWHCKKCGKCLEIL